MMATNQRKEIHIFLLLNVETKNIIFKLIEMNETTNDEGEEKSKPNVIFILRMKRTANQTGRPAKTHQFYLLVCRERSLC